MAELGLEPRQGDFGASVPHSVLFHQLWLKHAFPVNCESRSPKSQSLHMGPCLRTLLPLRAWGIRTAGSIWGVKSPAETEPADLNHQETHTSLTHMVFGLGHDAELMK